MADTEDDPSDTSHDRIMHHVGELKKKIGETLKQHHQMLDHFRSIDDIVKEGSNPSAESRFTSSSGRTPDDGSSPLGGRAK